MQCKYLLQFKVKPILSIGLTSQIVYAYRKVDDLKNKLQSIYAKAKVCENSTCISFDPNITDIFKSSRDYNQLLNIWKGKYSQILEFRKSHSN